METISYEYEGALYVNLTNRCDCRCVFCLRHNGHKGSIYADDLWLDHEPSRQEALDDLLARDYSQYRELVFCGFGEPMYRTDDLLWLVDRLKEQVPNLPPVRINTNGHANLILGRDVTPELKGRIDTISISLNGSTAEEYCAVTKPKDGVKAWEAMLDFAKKARDYVPHVVMTIVDKDKTPEEICAYIGADSLAFLSVEGLLACVPAIGESLADGAPDGAACPARGYCTACFTGVYPVAIPESFGRDKFMPGYDPCNLTQATALPRDVITTKDRDRSWESAHRA